MQLHLHVRRTARWLCITLLLLVVFAIGAFGLLQTSGGLGWAGRSVAGLLSSSGFSVAIQDLEGMVPFDMRARRIDISDTRGMWLRIDNAHLALAAGGLLTGRVHIKELTAGQIEIDRAPEAAQSEPVPLSERLRLPTLPVGVMVDRLAVDRLALGIAVLGEPIEATLAGRAMLGDEASEITLDLHRTDNVPGGMALDLRQSGGTNPEMALGMHASEPTGVLLARVLNREDRPALSVSLTGEGRLADWHGRLEASAGELARLQADITIAAARDSVLTLAGTASVARLLPPEMAVLAGDSMPVTGRATLKENGTVSLDRLSVDMAAGQLTADLALGGADRAVAGHIRASLPKLESASGLVGQPTRGSAEVSATISGTESQPTLQIDATGKSIGIATSGAEQVDARITIGWSGNTTDPSARIQITGSGRFGGIVLPENTPRDLGRDLDWSLSVNAVPDGSAAELTDLTARGAGIDVAATGKAGRFGQELDGVVRLRIADLRPFTGLFGRPVEGMLAVDVTASQPTPDRVTATIEGTIGELRAGVPAVDALAGGSVTIAGSAQRDPGGLFRLERLRLTGAGLNLTAVGSFDSSTQQLAATLDGEIRDLRSTGVAFGATAGGRLSANVVVEGDLYHPRLRARLEGNDLTAGTAALDRMRLEADIPDAALPRVALTGNFRSGPLDGTLSLEAEQREAGEVAIRRLQLKAADGVIDGDLGMDLRTLLLRGTITGNISNLVPWSRLAGRPLAGRLNVKAGLDSRAGQSLDLTVNGDRLSSGAAQSRITIGHLGLTARLSDLLGTPFGTGRATLTGASLPSGELTSAMLTVESPRPGRFTFGGEAKGKLIDPLTLALGGTGEMAPNGFEVRVSRLGGAVGADRFQLTRPLVLTKRGNDLGLTGLGLSIGSGQITANASQRGAALSADLAVRNLSIGSVGRLAGYHDAGGTVTLDAIIGGTVTAPQGRFTLSGRELRFGQPKRQRLPKSELDLAGTWNGRELALTGKASGLHGDRIELSGSAPLVLTSGMSVAIPAQGRLAFRLQGGGELGNLADLLPVGEDRVAGKFALDAAVTGTPAAPAVSGRLTITDGRYENFATGAVLTKMQLDLAGDRDRVTLREFSAQDSATGSLSAGGSVVLAATGQSAEVSIMLKGFRIVSRDEAVLAASGTVTIAGTIASPKVTARLTTDQGDLTIPDSLPPNVTRLQVVEINSRAPKQLTATSASIKPSAPALPTSLDIQIAVPGRIFVRGRGLDSEWRGRISVTGTSEAPKIAGSLEALRGTFDFLGKTFKLTRGNIDLDGASTMDPTLDIVAEISAVDITAKLLVKGPASSPKITITSIPVVPQDEILSRVLFNGAVGQITAAQGIQVAQAAATLAGGGPGVLDRLRGRLGLDRLVFGSAPSGIASSNLNPAAGGNAVTSTAVSGGKYVADGVYVGATQGLTPQSSKVIVEIEVRPRVTVQGDFSQTGGSGLGLNYKYDY